MKKPTPNPPETPDISPYESLESKKFHEAAERALDHHFKPAVDPHLKRENGLFKLSPGTDAEALMANASEDLLSISVIACDLADDLHGSRRSVALALSRMADGVRLMVEGTLDQIEVRSVAAKP
ncbi:hypothetical protein EVS84_06750 [Pseudomonas koreensis]|jgi:hypothetical protein|uniref:DUF3077 domain-containing protein n=2 Tax=Pseudomonas TaxID=286 RepID=A0A4Q4L7S9_9PSED|nr:MULTISPECIES: DUF6124 family protein [Pseudomonas]MDM8189780.1 DUF6124 family protein [Pseudomonas fluorescens]MDP8571025.1 DUF6124 family protein [Pseudomonas iranensis]RYM43592.1 hypothetical protein EVS84_06750 [Pseudomonas koreensis]